MAGKFHITVGVAPEIPNLTVEIQLLKAALLYADAVTLCSPAASMMEIVSHFVHLKNYDLRLDFLLKHAQEIKHPPEEIMKLINIHRGLKRQRHRTRGQQAIAKAFYEQLDMVWEEIGKVYDEMAEKAGAQGITSAIKSGIVTLC